ncbi:transposase [Sporomusa silvacetica]
MYKFTSKQMIPWDELEKEYATLFTGKNGQVAKPLRLALGAMLIQIEYGYSDEETVLQIQGNPYLQFFCGLSGPALGRPKKDAVIDKNKNIRIFVKE